MIAIVTTGFRVVEPTPDGTGKTKPLSRIFAVRSSAELFAQIARREGHPMAVVENVIGTDDAGRL